MIQIINDIDFCIKQWWFCKYMNYEVLQELLEDDRFKWKDFLEIPEWVWLWVWIYYKWKTPEESFIFIKE